MSANAALRLPEAVVDSPPEPEEERSAAPEHDGEQDSPLEQQDERSTSFVFEHKVFGVPEVYFALTTDRKPALHIAYGDLKAQIETRSLRRGFAIEPQSNDDRMLRTVEKSLRFVRQIRPNDSIPREVLDGSASWAAEERHQVVAHGRLTLQLASWATGQMVHVKRSQIADLVKNPAIVARVEAAVSEIAKRLGLAAGEERLVLDRVAAFAKELSYIEAIRERFENARTIEHKAAKLMAIYKMDRVLGESLMRVISLIKGPFSAFNVKFSALDKDTSDVVSICKSYDDKVAALRRTRDDMFELYVMWEPILESWQNVPLEMSKPAEETIRATFQFLARHYPQQTAWKRAR